MDPTSELRGLIENQEYLDHDGQRTLFRVQNGQYNTMTRSKRQTDLNTKTNLDTNNISSNNAIGLKVKPKESDAGNLQSNLKYEDFERKLRRESRRLRREQRRKQRRAIRLERRERVVSRLREALDEARAKIER